MAPDAVATGGQTGGMGSPAKPKIVPSGEWERARAGIRTLAELFDGRDQLVVYQFMDIGPAEFCPGCTGFSNNVTDLDGLAEAGVSWVTVSDMPLAQLDCSGTTSSICVPTGGRRTGRTPRRAGRSNPPTAEPYGSTGPGKSDSSRRATFCWRSGAAASLPARWLISACWNRPSNMA